MVAALVSSLIMPALPALATQEPETSASIIETVSVNAGIDGTADDLLDDLDAMAKKTSTERRIWNLAMRAVSK